MVRWFWGLGLSVILLTASADPIHIGEFSKGSLDGWEEKSFAGHTEYELKTNKAGVMALFAQSEASASGLFKELSADMRKTPYLNWHWQVDAGPSGNKERSKQGDDFAVRVYVIEQGFLWQLRSMTYVWSNNEPVESSWHNPFTDNARHIVLRSGSESFGQWLAEKRNIYQDWQKLFGEPLKEVSAIAVMTDTDNSAQSAKAWYGDLYFSAD